MKARTGPLLSNLTTAIVAVGLTLLAAEAAVRLLWSNAPPSVAAADTLPVLQIRDREILYRFIPGAKGHFNGTEIQVNSLGLRDRDYAIPAPPGTRRILVLGDSMVFGIGLRPEQTLAGQLTRLMAPAEVINAGVFGYNLAQEISLLRDIGLKYGPDVVVSCFVHNDIDNWGLGEGGAVPEIKSSRFDPPPRTAWSTRLADLMLPGTLDLERLNLLPRVAERRGLRARLASASRLYLFAYLRLRTHSWNLTSGERRDALVDSDTCLAEELIWTPLRERYRQLRSLVEGSGGRLVVVIQGGLLWEGLPLARLQALLREEGIPFLDLTPVWLDPDHYAREHSLGWDPHPNAEASRLSAELIAAFLDRTVVERAGRTGDATDPHGVIRDREDLNPRLVEWESRQSRLVGEAETAREAQIASFSSDVVFTTAGAKAGSGAQILYGFWRPENDRPPPGGGADRGWWMSDRAGVLLKRPAGARRLTIEMVLPDHPAALELTPATLSVHLTSQPATCGAVREDLAVKPRLAGRVVTLQSGLTPEAARGDFIEVDLRADRPFQATYIQEANRDPRLVSFMIRRIGVD